jgi:hypothetical protein
MAKVAMAIASTTGKKIKGSIAPKKKESKSRLNTPVIYNANKIKSNRLFVMPIANYPPISNT